MAASIIESYCHNFRSYFIHNVLLRNNSIVTYFAINEKKKKKIRKEKMLLRVDVNNDLIYIQYVYFLSRIPL